MAEVALRSRRVAACWFGQRFVQSSRAIGLAPTNLVYVDTAHKETSYPTGRRYTYMQISAWISIAWISYLNRSNPFPSNRS